MKARILFVDDEPRVLSGLRRMLADQDREWAMHFVESGPAALEFLAGTAVDVIVSDLRMPGMDGAELLQKIQELHPGTIRLVLSGYAEKEFLGRAFLPSHQFLSKPCSKELLIATIADALKSRNFLSRSGLRSLVGSLGRLPSLPELHRQITQELAREDPSIEKLGEIISRDVAMTARLLKLVNSPFFGVARKIVSPAQALNLVGINYLQSLIMVLAVFDSCKVDIQGLSLGRLLDHSLRTACVAERIASMEELPTETRDEYRTAGLLHDVGKLILASNLAAEYTEIIRIVQRESRPVLEVEREVLGATHAEMGAYLLRLWGLSDGVVEAVLLHHAPCLLNPSLSPSLAVYCANILDRELVVINPGYARPEIELEYLQRSSLGQHVELWRDEARVVCERMTSHEAQDTHR